MNWNIKKIIFFVCCVFVIANAYELSASPLTQTVTLKEGFNFISFTVIPSITAHQLIQQYQTIEDIYLYSSSAGSFLSVGSGELVTLNPGKGYIIKAKYSDIININGTDILNIGDIIMKPGYNLIGFSKIKETVKAKNLI